MHATCLVEVKGQLVRVDALFFTTCSLVTERVSSGLLESTFTRRAMSPVPRDSSSDEKQAKIVLMPEFLENPWMAVTSIVNSPWLALLSFSEDLMPQNDTCKPAGYKFLLRRPSQLGVAAQVCNPRLWKLQGGCHLRPAPSTQWIANQDNTGRLYLK